MCASLLYLRVISVPPSAEGTVIFTPSQAWQAPHLEEVTVTESAGRLGLRPITSTAAIPPKQMQPQLVGRRSAHRPAGPRAAVSSSEATAAAPRASAGP